MANYQNLEAFMKSRIYENDQHAITGDSTQDVLDLMIKVLGFGFQFGGIATPDGIPEETDARVFYLAVEPGTYDNYGGVELEAQRLGVITYSDEWALYAIPMLSEVNTDDIVNAAVTANKIENGAVETDKIADGAVTHAKLANDAVESDNIKDGAVSASKLADNAVESSKIKDSAVSTDKLADDAVTENKIKNGSVTENKIGDDAVTENKIKDGAVTYPKLNIPSALLVGMVLQNVQEGVIEAQSNHYYNIGEDVDALTVTLPTLLEQRTDRVAFHFVAGSHPSLVIDGGEVPVFRSGASPKPHKEYIVTCFYNGVAWNVSAECITPSDCITFQSAQPFTAHFTRKAWEGSLEYSNDGNVWHEVELNGVMSSAWNGTREVLFLRGYGNTTIGGSQRGAFFIFDGANVHCVGNINTLLNHKNPDNAIIGDYAFQDLFRENTAIVSPPELPAKVLALDCYRCLFRECANLVEAPELPATTLAETCYDGTFNGCSLLAEAPELPAKELVYGCYNGMFAYCNSLTTAPKLPATTLAESCYSNMFYECTSLTTAPELPATTLAVDCYKQMFLGCSSLINVPAILPATTLANECYRSMFTNCSSLTEAPELPATTLAAYCYRGMFGGCNIITAPDLPATTLAESCYQTMFKNNSRLNSVKMLATDISAVNCLNNWLDGVAAEGVLTKAAAMTTLPSGPSGVPTGWTTVDA